MLDKNVNSVGHIFESYKSSVNSFLGYQYSKIIRWYKSGTSYPRYYYRSEPYLRSGYDVLLYQHTFYPNGFPVLYFDGWVGI